MLIQQFNIIILLNQTIQQISYLLVIYQKQSQYFNYSNKWFNFYLYIYFSSKNQDFHFKISKEPKSSQKQKKQDIFKTEEEKIQYLKQLVQFAEKYYILQAIKQNAKPQDIKQQQNKEQNIQKEKPWEERTQKQRKQLIDQIVQSKAVINIPQQLLKQKLLKKIQTPVFVTEQCPQVQCSITQSMQQSSVNFDEKNEKQLEQSALLSSICKTSAQQDYSWLKQHFKDQEKYISSLLTDLQSFLNNQIEPPIPLFLNVYNLQSSNFLPKLGIGVFHTAIQILDNEYAFGGHQLDETGIYCIIAKSLSGAQFYKQIYMGHIFKSKRDICKDLLDCAIKYKGREYNILHNNCNDFTDDICKRLVGQGDPKWINRIAKFGGKFMKNMKTGDLTDVVAYQTNEITQSKSTPDVGGDDQQKQTKDDKQKPQKDKQTKNSQQKSRGRQSNIE